MIEKKIHFCWFGGEEYSPLIDKCLLSWKTNLPDWEIILWNEKNSPSDNKYMQKAIKYKQYAFASDYMRFYALYFHGGIYLDTDVEVVKDLSPLLVHSCFVSSEHITNEYYNAAVIGAEKNHPLIEAVLKFYDEYHGEFKTVPTVLTKIIKNNDFDLSILPYYYFYPYNPYDDDQPVKQLFFSDIKPDTFAIHHWNKSWSVRLPFFPRKIKQIKNLFKKK